MSPLWIELHQWCEDKPTEMKSGVWDGQGWVGRDQVVIQEQIEIEGPRSLSIVRIAPKRPFDLTADFQQALGRNVGCDLHHTI